MKPKTDYITIDTNYGGYYADYTGKDDSGMYKGFINQAFVAAEQEIIPAEEVDNSTTSGATAAYVCDNTYDKIFLLSYKDIKGNYSVLNSDKARLLHVTDYALGLGSDQANFDESSKYYYARGTTTSWTRSPGTSSSTVYTTFPAGSTCSIFGTTSEGLYIACKITL